MSSMASPAGRSHLFSRKLNPSGFNRPLSNDRFDHRSYRGGRGLPFPPEEQALTSLSFSDKSRPLRDYLRVEGLKADEKKPQNELSIHKIRKELLRAVKLSDVVIVTAETGAGKSTQVPQMLLDEGYSVVMTQPRRLAASSVALRIASERKGVLGEEVGFRHALQDAVGKDSKLVVSTDGFELVRALHGFPHSQPDVLIIDEFHERNLSMDALLALHEKRLDDFHRGKGPKPPKLIIMSATIDAERLSEHFGAPVLSAKGRTFPIQQREPGESIAHDAIALANEGKNVLVFLPGKPEIRALQDQLEELGANAEILPLHSQLSTDEQERVFQKFERPKIVLATNIAETSITIPDIDAVIDSGLEKDVELIDGVETLSAYAISKFNVLQRMGRCGRCGPGVYVYHGITPIEQLSAMPSPEIERVCLEKLMLTLASGGEKIERLPFLNPPPSEHIALARRSLYQLNLFGPTSFLTEEGRRVAELPVAVRTGKMLVRAQDLDRQYPGVLENAIDIAAIIEAEGIVVPESRRRWGNYCRGEFESDHIAQLRVFQAAKGRTSFVAEQMGIDATAFRRAVELTTLLDRRLGVGVRPVELSHGLTPLMRQKLLECVWTGMIDSVFRRVRTEGRDSFWRGVHSRGERKLSRGSVVSDGNIVVGRAFDLVIMKDHDESKTIPLVLMASAVNPEWVLKNATPQLKSDIKEPIERVKRRNRSSRRPADLYSGGKRFGRHGRR